MERFYLSLASSSQRFAAKTLNYPYILVNYMTRMNRPPDYRYEGLFIDSGGFSSSLKSGGYTRTDDEYLQHVEELQPDYYALRDYPCEPELLQTHNRTVEMHQALTVDHHLKLLDKIDDYQISGSWVPVLQGWTLEEYLDCIDLFKEHGLLSDYVAIGSVCRRGSQDEIRKIISVVKHQLGGRRLHAFGLNLGVLRDPHLWGCVYSVDSGAFDYAARKRRWIGDLQGLSMNDAALVCLQDTLTRVHYLRGFHEGQGVLV